MNDDFAYAYFEADSSKSYAFIPIKMVSSMHIESIGDGYWEAVFVTVSGKEYNQSGFDSCQAAMDFCKTQMKEISRYNKACALGKNQ